MADYYHFIESESELKWFYDHCVELLEPNESYMFVMSARHKNLTAEEKEEYDLGRSEMLSPEIIYCHENIPLTFEQWAKGIYRYECNKKALTTRNGKPFPEKALVLYYYINPCDEMKVAKDITNYIGIHNQELVDSALKGSSDGICQSMIKLKYSLSHMKRCHATNTSRKVWLDFDMDVKKSYREGPAKDIILSSLRKNLEKFFGKGNYVIVKTTGGYHSLVRKEALTFNPRDFIDAVLNTNVKFEDPISGIPDTTYPLEELVDEFIKNDNGFIPTPGTLQYGNLVTVVNKGDFEEK